MAEVKKRGRPPKKKDELVELKNENTKEIKMEQQISIEQPYNRMREIFTRFNSKEFGYNDYLAAMGASFDNNPFIKNTRLKNINSPITITEKTKLDKAIKNPAEHEELFRGESQSLYFQNYVYSNLLKINREVPQYFNYAIPVDVSEEECKKKEFRKEMRFVNEILRKFNIKKMAKDIAMDIALEGKRSYIFRTSHDNNKETVDFALFQKIPSRWIKYTNVGSTTDYVTSLDFMMFLEPGESLDNYPKSFKKIWEDLICQEIFQETSDGKKSFNPSAIRDSNRHKDILEMIDGRWMYWVELPQGEVFEFGADNSHALQLPDYIGLFSDLRGLDDYKWLQNQLLSKAVNSVLVGTVPLIKDHNLAGGDQTAISMDSIIGFSDMFTDAVSSNIMPFFAPFTDYKLLSLPLPPDAKEINNTALKNLINTSGMGALISTTDKPSIISVKTAQQLAESKAEYLTLQIQFAINHIINTYYGLKYKYKIVIWGGLFTFREQEKMLKELILSGYTGLLPRLLSIEDMTIEDFVSTNNYINAIEGLKNCIPMSKLGPEEVQATNSNDQRSITNNRGRKPVGDNLENDNTATSLDIGNNVSDIKEFSTSENKCICCGTEIEYGEYLCDDCLEMEYEQRLEKTYENLQIERTNDNL